MKWIKRILLLIVVAIGLLVYFNYSKLNMISGYAAKYMTSGVLIGGHSPDYLKEVDLDFPLIRLADSDYNSELRESTSTVFGLMERQSKFREGLGTVLIPSDDPEEIQVPQPQRTKTPIDLPYPYGNLAPKDSVFAEIDYDAFKKAVQMPFDRPDEQKTRTLVVLYKGHLVHENYVDGFDKDTPILGWSMTKSVLATFFGVLDQQGGINIKGKAPIVEWQDDERKNITIDNLLRMESGLEWDESYDKISDVTRMLFLDSDMTKAQMDKEAIAKPTEVWNYSSGTTNLLSGILRQQFNTHQEYLDFPYHELIDKIGAHSMVIEADWAGNYVGSSYGWANTRDWAKLGQLYLDKGQWNSEQILTPEWVDYVAQPNADSNGRYGAHFWLNAGGFHPDVPKDMYSMNGFQGQHVFIIPSKDLVVVRSGLVEKPVFDINGFLSALCKSIR